MRSAPLGSLQPPGFAAKARPLRLQVLRLSVLMAKALGAHPPPPRDPQATRHPSRRPSLADTAASKDAATAPRAPPRYTSRCRSRVCRVRLRDRARADAFASRLGQPPRAHLLRPQREATPHYALGSLSVQAFSATMSGPHGTHSTASWERNVRLAACIVGIYFFYIWYAIIQERMYVSSSSTSSRAKKPIAEPRSASVPTRSCSRRSLPWCSFNACKAHSQAG